MTQEKDIGQPPVKSSKDSVHSISKGFVSFFVPGGGELFEMIVKSPLEQRRDKWLMSIFERFVELERKIVGFRAENLSNDENFKSLLLSATIIALRNHQKEKLDALRNVVLNTALPNELEDDLQLMFLHIIDQMTTWHLKLLDFLQNPTIYKEKIKSEKSKEYLEDVNNSVPLLICLFPELEGKEHVIERILDDLFRTGLSDNNIIRARYTPYGLLSGSHVSKFGNIFIQFISDVDTP